MSGIIVKTKETKPPNTKLELAQRKDDEMRNPCVKVLLLAVIFVIFWTIIESLHMYVHLPTEQIANATFRPPNKVLETEKSPHLKRPQEIPHPVFQPLEKNDHPLFGSVKKG